MNRSSTKSSKSPPLWSNQSQFPPLVTKLEHGNLPTKISKFPPLPEISPPAPLQPSPPSPPFATKYRFRICALSGAAFFARPSSSASLHHRRRRSWLQGKIAWKLELCRFLKTRGVSLKKPPVKRPVKHSVKRPVKRPVGKRDTFQATGGLL